MYGQVPGTKYETAIVTLPKKGSPGGNVYDQGFVAGRGRSYSHGWTGAGRGGFQFSSRGRGVPTIRPVISQVEYVEIPVKARGSRQTTRGRGAASGRMSARTKGGRDQGNKVNNGAGNNKLKGSGKVGGGVHNGSERASGRGGGLAGVVGRVPGFGSGLITGGPETEKFEYTWIEYSIPAVKARPLLCIGARKSIFQLDKLSSTKGTGYYARGYPDGATNLESWARDPSIIQARFATTELKYRPKHSIDGADQAYELHLGSTNRPGIDYTGSDTLQSSIDRDVAEQLSFFDTTHAQSETVTIRIGPAHGGTSAVNKGKREEQRNYTLSVPLPADTLFDIKTAKSSDLVDDQSKKVPGFYYYVETNGNPKSVDVEDSEQYIRDNKPESSSVSLASAKTTKGTVDKAKVTGDDLFTLKYRVLLLFRRRDVINKAVV